MSRSVTIDTLVPDIYNLLSNTEEELDIHMNNLSIRPRKERKPRTIWASDLGEKCRRKLWYKFNTPEDGEPIPSHTLFKFNYGNAIEDMLYGFAEASGHEVRDQQKRVEYETDSGWTVSGRMDAVVDGWMTDAKSTSTYGFKKYKDEGLTEENDTFGYRYQLGFYTHFSGEVYEGSGFIWAEKQNGHILWQPTEVPSRYDLEQEIEYTVYTAERADLPERGYSDKPQGKSGNRQLEIACQYCPFNKKCWQDANGGLGLRTFLYSHGPVYLTQVINEPRVVEV